MMQNYHTLHDLVLDTHFCSWVCGTDPEAAVVWEAWLAAHPEKAGLVNRARKIVLDLNSRREQVREHEKAEMWANIMERKDAGFPPPVHHHAKIFGYSFLSGWGTASRVAASLAGIILLCAGLLWLKPFSETEMTRYETSYGEIKSISLPDGSNVVLNANSTLSFVKDWSGQKEREVQLLGEAFFSVTHKQNRQKFKVKLAEDIAVEVLGTKFTVTRRPQKTRVVLNEGKVKIAVTEANLPGLSSKVKASEMLRPGELIELGERADVLSRKHVPDPAIYSAFQYNKLIFSDAPLTEVARVLKDTYGYEVTFLQADIAHRRFTGTIPSDRIDILYAALERLFNLKITEEGKQIQIS